MTVLVDLHMHTSESDGRLSPEELVDLVGQTTLEYIAITDHDSTLAIDRAKEAARKYPSLTVIPGVEMSTDVEGGEMHLLGYFVDRHNEEFQQILADLRQGREVRAKKMVERLASLGMPVSWERVKELADGGAIGRPHIAQALVEKGYLATPQEAFHNYIGRNGPAYVEREKLTPEDAVRLIVRMEGLPVLAHPGDTPDLDSLLGSLKTAGLVGMEVYYGSYPRETVERLAATARRHGLVPCGGSDFHGLGYFDEAKPGAVGPPRASVLRLMELVKVRSKKAERV
ncbi:MAG: PHP domain-containing protein [Chloroflexi bacterium]|nr:PHP domain-containing protein [Chloroflexota bacterium]